MLASWGPCPGGGGGGPAAEGGFGGEFELLLALGHMGFASVDEFIAWSGSLPSVEALAAGLELADLLQE